MVISVNLALAVGAVIFLLGIILGSLVHRHVSGRLVIDDSGETERWSFLMEDSIEQVKSKSYILLRIEKVD